ncbi:MAG: PIG-L family deacetylase [Eubacterium sp.]|nr:PIG-L family deacetylase [Eubacterium sp.]
MELSGNIKKRLVAIVLSLSIIFSAFFAADITAYAREYKSKNNSFTVTTLDLKRPTLLKKGSGFKIKGKLKGNNKIMKLEFSIYDRNQFSDDISVERFPEKYSVNLKNYIKSNWFSSLPSGEKTLKITAYNKKGETVRINLNFTVLGKAKEPRHITNKCKVYANTKNAKNVLDKSDDSYWRSGKLTVELPDNKTADGVYIKWFYASNTYTLKSYDEEGKVLDEYDNKNTHVLLNNYYKLSKNAKKIVIRLKNKRKGQGIATLRVYEENKVGISVQKWKVSKRDECDLMVISAHRDDELLFFGGTIPYYTKVRKKNVCVVYMSGSGRERHREALDGLWSMGCTVAPIFMNFEAGYHNGISGTLNSWGGEQHVISRLVEQIRKYKPKVIVTHDINGEYGHPTHRTVPYVVINAVKAAGDKSKYKSSCNEYGICKVKKLYLHMYSKHTVNMSAYSKSAKELDYKTPFSMACVGFDKHYSQHNGWSMHSKAVKKYPSYKYGLYYTRVGYDKKKNDFFENIKNS